MFTSLRLNQTLMYLRILSTKNQTGGVNKHCIGTTCCQLDVYLRTLLMHPTSQVQLPNEDLYLSQERRHMIIQVKKSNHPVFPPKQIFPQTPSMGMRMKKKLKYKHLTLRIRKLVTLAAQDEEEGFEDTAPQHPEDSPETTIGVQDTNPSGDNCHSTDGESGSGDGSENGVFALAETNVCSPELPCQSSQQRKSPEWLQSIESL